MIAAGIECRLDLRVAGRETAPLGTLQLSEDLAEGCALRFRMDADDADPPALRDDVVISMSTPSSSSTETTTTVKLWTVEVRLEDDGRGRTASVLAVDPLSFAARGVQFRSWGGRVPLARLAGSVLSSQPFRPSGVPEPQGEAPTVPADWLLQSNESGRDFLGRVAASLGVVLYWDRDRFAIGTRRRGPDTDPGRVSVDFSNGLFRRVQVVTPGPDPERYLWIDPVSREASVLEAGSGDGARPLLRRVAEPSRPERAGTLAGSEATGPCWEVSCHRAGIRLGTRLDLPDEQSGLVASLSHEMNASGSYQVTAHVVPPERWGVAGPRHPAANGPFQGEVTHNDDPLGRGRIRVALVEDAERRPTPWIPFVPPAAGAEVGWHWLPEVGDLVLLMADAESPESLYALGALRGKDKETDSDWRSPDNAKKVLAARGGLRILLDDRAGSLEIAGPAASIVLERDGTMRLSGAKLELDMREEASVRAGRRLLLDAARIDLGA